VKGWLKYGDLAANTSESYLLDPPALLGAYSKSAGIYKCPADQSRSDGASGPERVRSRSMNSAFRTGKETVGKEWLDQMSSPGTFKKFHKENELNNPAPVDLFVFTDEHPDSINDGSFAVQMPTTVNQTAWVDWPSKYHGNAGNFAFADGHSEIHRWRHPEVIPNVTFTTKDPNTTISSARNEDIIWVAKHTTGRTDGAALPY
jgi:prepilin-type processing-associated H-X9-DG protein